MATVFGSWRHFLEDQAELFIPDRGTAGTSDVLIETSGAVLGFVGFRRLLKLTEGRTVVIPTSAAKPGDSVRIPMGLGVFVTEYTPEPHPDFRNIRDNG